MQPNLEDELQPEYDLTTLRVHKIGSERTEFNGFVQLAPDAAEENTKI